MGHLIFSLSILIFLSVICIIMYRRIDEHSGLDHLLFAGLFLLLWILCYTFYYYEPRRNIAIYWYLFQCFSKSMVFVTLWIFSIFTISPFYKMRREIYLTFYIIPALTALFALTNDTSGMLFSYIDVVKIYPEKQLDLIFGIWYYIDFFYNFFCLVIPIIIFINQLKSVPINFRYQYITYIIAFFIILTFQIFSWFNIYTGYDLSLFGAVGGFIVIYWSLYHYRFSDLLIFAKDTIFQKITCVCLVIEPEGKILDSNPQAKQLFSFYTKKLEDSTYGELREQLIKRRNATFEVNDDGEILKMFENGRVMFFQIQQSPIKDKNSNIIGYFIEIRDTTAQQELILELYKQANCDQLTKLYNRRFFELMCEKMDNDSYFPLCIVSGDLNRLKFTNDTFGHQAGDRLIVKISEILKEAAPENAVIARPGGDEFQILLPSTDEFAAKQFIKKVETLCECNYEEPFGNPSISLGYAIKKNHTVSIEEIIKKADICMYNTKREMKRLSGDDIKGDPRLNF